MKKFTISFAALFLIAALTTGSATAAENRTEAGEVLLDGEPVLVIDGANRMESFMVTAYSSVPPGGSWDDPEIPIWSISDIVGAVKLGEDSTSGRCWQQTSSVVYCRRDGAVKTIIASLGGGNDTLVVDKSLRVVADGGPGRDSIYGGNKNDILSGGPGNDYLQGEGGNDILNGGPGNDRLIGDKYRDASFPKPLRKPAGKDRINGGPGNDSIQGGGGADIVFGGPGNDSFDSNRDGSRDRIVGGAGRDSVRDPDTIRRKRKLKIRESLSGIELLFIGVTRYRVR